MINKKITKNIFLNQAPIIKSNLLNESDKRGQYISEKYNKLPIQLGKIIISLSKKKEYNSKEKLINYIIENYSLLENESKNILTSLKLNYEY